MFLAGNNSSTFCSCTKIRWPKVTLRKQSSCCHCKQNRKVICRKWSDIWCAYWIVMDCPAGGFVVWQWEVPCTIFLPWSFMIVVTTFFRWWVHLVIPSVHTVCGQTDVFLYCIERCIRCHELDVAILPDGQSICKEEYEQSNCDLCEIFNVLYSWCCLHELSTFRDHVVVSSDRLVITGCLVSVDISVVNCTVCRGLPWTGDNGTGRCNCIKEVVGVQHDQCLVYSTLWLCCVWGWRCWVPQRLTSININQRLLLD